MTTSGQYNFNPSLGDTVLYAFGLCDIRPTEISQQHMWTARMAANMLLSRWSGQTPNLWTVDLETIPLVQGQATYTLPDNTIVMLDTYVVQNNGGASINRLILPISRSEYASYPQPTQQGFPTTYWMDRVLAPTVTLWPVPNGEQSSLNYYRVRQVQDANYISGQTVEVPYYFIEAFAIGLAQRLAVTYAPALAIGLKAWADEAYTIAADQNVEDASFYVSPTVSGYWRT